MDSKLVTDIAQSIEGDYHCITCKGSGKAFGRECYRCNGKGKHNQDDRVRNFMYTLNNPFDSWVDGVKGSWAIEQGIPEPGSQAAIKGHYNLCQIMELKHLSIVKK